MAINPLEVQKFVFFRTREYAFQHDVSVETASRQLHRLMEKQVIVKVTRGLWANTHHPFYTPLGCVPYLIDQEQGYVSFLTVLYYAGLISQIPRSIYIATTGHPRRLVSAIGTFEFFQIKPSMMRHGVNWAESKIPYRIASVEKALLDTLYISTRRGRRFASLPELDWKGATFNHRTFKALLDSLPTSNMIRDAMISKYKALKTSN